MTPEKDPFPFQIVVKSTGRVFSRHKTIEAAQRGLAWAKRFGENCEIKEKARRE